MIDGTKLFIQLLRIALGFSLAIIAAGLFLSWGFFRTLSVNAGEGADIIQLIAITWSTIISASVFGGLSLIPSGFAIGIAELMRWRGVIYHVSAGGIIALVLWGVGGAFRRTCSSPQTKQAACSHTPLRQRQHHLLKAYAPAQQSQPLQVHRRICLLAHSWQRFRGLVHRKAATPDSHVLKLISLALPEIRIQKPRREPRLFLLLLPAIL